MQAALNQVAPVASAWFGPPGDATLTALGGAGILSANSTRLRETWLSRVRPLLARCDLSLPAVEHDWSTWNAERREAES